MWHTVAYCMLVVIFFVLGFVCGRSSNKPNMCGRLVVNTTDPKKDVLRFELSCSIGEILANRTITFEVANEDSQ